MKKKDLKNWIKNLERKGVPMGYIKQQEPPKQYDAEHIAHMRRNLELK
jgi:hypothetical protein